MSESGARLTGDRVQTRVRKEDRPRTGRNIYILDIHKSGAGRSKAACIHLQKTDADSLPSLQHSLCTSRRGECRGGRQSPETEVELRVSPFQSSYPSSSFYPTPQRHFVHLAHLGQVLPIIRLEP